MLYVIRVFGEDNANREFGFSVLSVKQLYEILKKYSGEASFSCCADCSMNNDCLECNPHSEEDVIFNAEIIAQFEDRNKQNLEHFLNAVNYDINETETGYYLFDDTKEN